MMRTLSEQKSARQPRRAVLAALAVSPLCGLTWAADGQLPVPTSLPEALDGALTRGEPLVLMVSLVGCPFCRIVRDHYLVPALRAGTPVFQIDFRDARPIIDFAGRTTTQGALVKALGITVAPTVLFVGRGGSEVAERLAGTYISDFYAAYLEQRLELSRTAVRS